jgi:hypothetical protein
VAAHAALHEVGGTDASAFDRVPWLYLYLEATSPAAEAHGVKAGDGATRPAHLFDRQKERMSGWNVRRYYLSGCAPRTCTPGWGRWGRWAGNREQPLWRCVSERSGGFVLKMIDARGRGTCGVVHGVRLDGSEVMWGETGHLKVFNMAEKGGGGGRGDQVRAA